MNRPAIRLLALALVTLAPGLAGRSARAASPPTYSLQWKVSNLPMTSVQEHDLALDAAGHVLVTANTAVSTYDGNGNLLASFGSSGTGAGQFTGLWGIGLDAAGNVYTAETYNNRVQKFTASGTPLLMFGTFGAGDGQVNYPFDAAARSDGTVYVADQGNARVEKFDAAGNYVAQWTTFDGIPLVSVFAIATDGANDVYVLDGSNGRIVEMDPSDAFVRSIPIPVVFSLGMSVAANGDILFTDADNALVYAYDASGALLYSFGSFGTGDGQFSSPVGVVEDAFGDVYVSDRMQHRVQKFVPTIPTPAQPTSWGRVKALYR